MAVRGQRPTPTVLRLVTGNPGKRPARDGAPAPKGPPVRPKWLKGRGAALWDEVLAFAYWLTVADSYKLALWCDRTADLEKPSQRKEWSAADRREWRSLGSELGLDPTSRERMKAPADDGAKNPASEFLG